MRRASKYRSGRRAGHIVKFWLSKTRPSVVCANKLLENQGSPERDRLLDWIGMDKITKERAWTDSIIILLFNYCPKFFIQINLSSFSIYKFN